MVKCLGSCMTPSLQFDCNVFPTIGSESELTIRDIPIMILSLSGV